MEIIEILLHLLQFSLFCYCEFSIRFCEDKEMKMLNWWGFVNNCEGVSMIMVIEEGRWWLVEEDGVNVEESLQRIEESIEEDQGSRIISQFVTSLSPVWSLTDFSLIEFLLSVSFFNFFFPPCCYARLNTFMLLFFLFCCMQIFLICGTGMVQIVMQGPLSSCRKFGVSVPQVWS